METMDPTVERGPKYMSQSGMDEETFEQFIEQLNRYVRERLIPAEPEVMKKTGYQTISLKK